MNLRVGPPIYGVPTMSGCQALNNGYNMSMTWVNEAWWILKPERSVYKLLSVTVPQKSEK